MRAALLLSALLWAAAARAAEPPLSFGSAALRDACWSAEELRAPDPGSGPAPTVDAGDRPSAKLPPLPPGLTGSIRRVSPLGREKVVALTFDLCEGPGERPGYDAGIVAYLRERGIPATFFAGGKWMRSHPEKTQQLMADPLFELGGHGWSHANLRLLSGPALAREVTRTLAEYEALRAELAARPCAAGLPAALEAVPRSLRLFRFPFGACGPEALGYLANAGIPAIQWDVVPGDPSPGQTAEGIAREVLDSVRPGSIVVLHANGRGRRTAEALALFVPELAARGYRFATVSELLRLGPAMAVSECYERKPGDTLRYGAPPKEREAP